MDEQIGRTEPTELDQALNVATLFELDDVIDPAETRGLIAASPAAATRACSTHSRPAKAPRADPHVRR